MTLRRFRLSYSQASGARARSRGTTSRLVVIIASNPAKFGEIGRRYRQKLHGHRFDQPKKAAQRFLELRSRQTPKGMAATMSESGWQINRTLYNFPVSQPWEHPI